MKIRFIQEGDPPPLKACWDCAPWAMLNSFQYKRIRQRTVAAEQGTDVRERTSAGQRIDGLPRYCCHLGQLRSSDSPQRVVHLAGAMGIPTRLALRWIPEWRWGLNGEQTAWYKSVRLFRQQKDGD